MAFQILICRYTKYSSNKVSRLPDDMCHEFKKELHNIKVNTTTTCILDLRWVYLVRVIWEISGKTPNKL